MNAAIENSNARDDDQLRQLIADQVSGLAAGDVERLVNHFPLAARALLDPWGAAWRHLPSEREVWSERLEDFVRVDWRGGTHHWYLRVCAFELLRGDCEGERVSVVTETRESEEGSCSFGLGNFERLDGCLQEPN